MTSRPGWGLRTFALIVSAHPYCARKFTRHVMHRTCALSSKVNCNRANGHRFDFAWTFLDARWPPFDGSFSLPIFYALRKNEKNLSSRILIILQNAPSNSVHLTSSFSCASVSNASFRVKVQLWKWWQYLKLLAPQIHLYKILFSGERRLWHRLY